MTVYKFANFINTELEEGISAGATEMIIPVAASQALPELEPGEEIRLVLWDGQQDPEIVSVTDNPQSGVLTIERSKEDTTAVAWEAGTQVRCVLTAEIINAALTAFFDLETVLEQSFLPLVGGTLTGALTLHGAPTAGLHAATKAYVDGLGSNALPTTGGTMSGNINMGSNQVIGLADPTVASSATRKGYVDNLISGVQGQIAAGAAVHTTTGTGSAYVIVTGQDIDTLSDGMAFIIRPHIVNEDDPTLKVDDTVAKPILVGDTGIFEDLLVANTPYTVVYDEDEDAWLLANITNVTTFSAPAGTRLLFQQTDVPAGWTKDITHDDKAIRVVSGTVVNNNTGWGFSEMFSEWTIAQENLPDVSLPHSLAAASHTHSVSVSGTTDTHAGHSHTYSRKQDNVSCNLGGANAVGGSTVSTSTGTAGAHAHVVASSGTAFASGSLSVFGTIALNGSGTPLDFNTKYVDVVIGEKD